MLLGTCSWRSASIIAFTNDHLDEALKAATFWNVVRVFTEALLASHLVLFAGNYHGRCIADIGYTIWICRWIQLDRAFEVEWGVCDVAEIKSMQYIHQDKVSF